MRLMFKRVLFFAMILSVQPAYAVDPGFYIGLMTGPASNTAAPTTGYVAVNQPVTVYPRQSQWGTRLFLGYKFNPYAAVEAGGDYFSNIRFETHDNQNTCADTDVQVYAVDVMGRLSYTLWSIEGYVKGGVAYTYIHQSPGFDTSLPCTNNSHTFAFRPVIGIGIGYDVTPSVVVDLSATRLMAGGIAKNINFYAIGVSYHIVNRYCGQFLCDD